MSDITTSVSPSLLLKVETINNFTTVFRESLYNQQHPHTKTKHKN